MGAVTVKMNPTGYTNCIAGDKGKIVTGSLSGNIGYLYDYNNTTLIWTVAMVSGPMFGVGDVCTIASGTGRGTVTNPAIDVYVCDVQSSVEYDFMYFVSQQWTDDAQRPIINISMPTLPGFTGLTGGWAIDLGRYSETLELQVVFQSMAEFIACRTMIKNTWSKHHPNRLYVGTQSWDGMVTKLKGVSNMEQGEDFLIKGVLEFYVGMVNFNLNWS